MITRKWFRFILTLFLFPFFSLQPLSQVSAQKDTRVRITQVDTSRFPNVTAYVSITNAAGEPIGVDPATIQIFEDGQVMAPVDIRGGGEEVGNVAIPVTTVLVIDISGSMDKNNKIGAAKNAAKAYVSGMRAVDRAGLIAYDTHVYIVQSVTSDVTAMVAAIDGLQTGSDTAMYDALSEAELVLENVSGRKAIIVLTDGMDNQSHSTANELIDGISESGLSISAIGFGDVNATGQAGLDEAGLKLLAERTGGQYAFATDAQTLSALYQQYGQSLQSEYAITYVSPSALRDGINRNMTVSLSDIGISMTGEYNPGGVLPEVSGRPGLLFGGILAALLALLVLPALFNRGVRALTSSKATKSRIRLDKPPINSKKSHIKFK